MKEDEVVQAIYVCTHGKAALEMVSSAEMICGLQENIGSTFFEIGESPEDLTRRIKNDLEKLCTDEGILFLTDIKGGTPFNVIAQMLKQYSEVHLLSGVNIPILVDIFIKRNMGEKINFDEEFLNTLRESIDKFELIPLEEEEF